MFLYRLCSYVNNNNNQTGYFKDIFCVLTKYNLVETVHSYMDTGQFPLKLAWKRLVNQRIKMNQESLWNQNDELSILSSFSLN